MKLNKLSTPKLFKNMRDADHAVSAYNMIVDIWMGAWESWKRGS